jgi:hypothetical protein
MRMSGQPPHLVLGRVDNVFKAVGFKRKEGS